MKSTLHESQSTFFIMSLSFVLRMTDVSDKSGGENQNTHFVFSTFFFSNRAVHEKRGKIF